MVVATYGSILAITDYPKEVYQNLKNWKTMECTISMDFMNQ